MKKLISLLIAFGLCATMTMGLVGCAGRVNEVETSTDVEETTDVVETDTQETETTVLAETTEATTDDVVNTTAAEDTTDSEQ